MRRRTRRRRQPSREHTSNECIEVRRRTPSHPDHCVGEAAGAGPGARWTAAGRVREATPEIMNQDPQIEDRTQDRVGFPAHKIVGNLYYIGTVTLSSYLITTPQGNIVINSDYEETLPLMKKAIESLGFKMED